MAYQGISPRIYQQNNLTNVQLIDDISSQFNGTTTTFTMTSGGDTFHAVSSRAIFIVLGGVVQEPDVDYTTAGDQITFTTPPVSLLTFAGRKIYGLNKLEGINDGLVTPSKLSLGGPSWDNSGNVTTSGYATISGNATVAGDIIQSGDTNNIFINTDTPTVRPTLDLNFERDQRLDSRITFTRSSTATYLGSDGLIKTALADQPRFDFDANGNCLGLLIEGAGTNYSLYSRRFDVIASGSWVPQNGGATPTVTADTHTAPDGTSSGVLMADTIAGATGTVFNGNVVQQQYTAASNVKHTFSLYIKLLTATQASIYIRDGATGSISSSNAQNTQDWQRVVVTSSAALTNGTMHSFYIGNANGTIAVWGSQIEDKAFATSYIPTVSSSETRAADNAIIRGTNFTDWYNSSASTLFMEGKLSGAISTGQYPFVAFEVESNNNRNNSFAITRRSGSGVRAVNYDSSGTQDIDITSSAWDGGSFKKFAYALDDSGSSSVLVDDGNVVGTNTSYATTSLSSVDILRFANHTSGGMTNFNVTIKSFKYYPKRLPNAQLQNLTK